MAKKREPDFVSLSKTEKERLLDRLEASNLSAKDREMLAGIVNAVVWLSAMLEHKKLSMRKLMRLFGFKREKQKDIFPSSKKSDGDDEPPAPPVTKGPEPKEPKPKKGHGRKPTTAYRVSETIEYKHDSLKSGDTCPSCLRGNLYELEAGNLVKIHGQTPFKAVNHRQERLRCATCGEIFKAKLPKEVPRDKYDDEAKSLLAVLRYQMGVPHNRLSRLQSGLGVPMPSSTQWDELEKAAAPARVIYKELIKAAAQGELFKIDDTTMRIIDLKKALKASGDERVGIYTSAILSRLSDGKKISLFFSANRHAGENLSAVLNERADSEIAPLLMCDALSANTKVDKELNIIHCLDHARRQFSDLAASFPEESQHVLEALGQVYYHDRVTKTLDMDQWQRLAFHGTHSKPVMDELEVWMAQRLAAHDTEENSPLGDAYKYMLNRWSRFCGFFRYVGAPLSNAACERQIKTAICHRRNSQQYRTLFGAFIGDIFMSIIQTCIHASKYPHEYITILQKYRKQVFADPQAWLPWNYEQTLAGIH